MKLYAAKNPKGKLMWYTLSDTKESVWYRTFACLDQEFQTKYWKQIIASRKAAKKLGYRIVEVKLVEVC
jgi:hypothetical protein